MKRITAVRSAAALLCVFTLSAASARAQPQAPEPDRKLFREIYQELVEINTTDSVGDTTRASEAMAARLRTAGFPDADVRVIVPPGAPKKGNLVVRYRGTGAKKPVLLLAHIDVVEARREDWERDPFKMVEEDGYFYGRGSVDDKAMAAIFVHNLIRYRKEGYRPERDLILALTADEEIGGKWNGAAWLLANHRDLVAAEFGLNEGGGGEFRNGKPFLLRVQAAEKISTSFRVESTNRGGHSSVPRPDNAIYELAEALGRFAKHQFPAKLNEITRGYFLKSAELQTGQGADDMRAVARGEGPDPQAAASLSAASPLYNSILRTTCVATRLEGGHATNALPQTARATINCRVLPGEPIDAVREEIVKALDNPKMTVTRISDPKPSPPSPLRPEITGPIERLTAEFWPGIPVVPSMSTGATDSLYMRNAGIPMYGVSGLLLDPSDNRSHGLNERMPIKSLYDGHEFLYRLVKALAGGK